ncbi:hypothetical protein HY570_00270 [Candidatus Micrarchaeota archaeon]|nr:hypothetical protein [Candidatus Micrarchaeota archaeon]
MEVTYEIRFAANLEEVQRVQAFEIAVWDEALSPIDSKPIRGAYKFYEKLWKLDRDSILCAFQDGVLVSYVAVERIRPQDILMNPLTTGRHMPPWSHDPDELYKQHGNVWYIINHSSKNKGASEQILKRLIDLAIGKGMHSIAVIFNLRHPYLRNPAEFWGRIGFVPVPDTYDPQWHYQYAVSEIPKGEFVSGAIIWARLLTRDERMEQQARITEASKTAGPSSGGSLRRAVDQDEDLLPNGPHYARWKPRTMQSPCQRNPNLRRAII